MAKPSLGTARELLSLREPRMAARRAHHTVQSGKTLREQVVKRNNRKNFSHIVTMIRCIHF